MAEYLTAYLSSMPVGQREAILRVVEQMKSNGLIATREQFDMQMEKLISALQGDGFFPNLKFERANELEPTRITSDMLNDNFQAIFVALGGLFVQMNRADATVTKHRQVRKSDFDKVRAATNKLLEDVAIYQFLKFTTGEWTEAKYRTFWNRRNANNTIKAAEIDDDTKKVRLRIGTSLRLHQYRGDTPTKISVESLSAGETGNLSKSFEPENALDNKFSTFWAHLLLADNSVRSDVDGTEVEGAAVRVTVEFPNAAPVSTLNLVPFGSHPVEMIDLEWWDGEEWQDVTGWTAEAASLDWQSFGFEQVQTQKLRFVLSQQNYTKNTYLVPRRLFTNSLLWEQVLDQELLIGVEEEELTGVQAAAADVNPKFRALFSAMKKFTDRLEGSGLDLSTEPENELTETIDAATRVMTGVREEDADVVLKALTGETTAPELSPEDMVEITKVEYLLGLRQISVEHRDYFPIGIWESPKFENQGTVYEVGLDTTEEHVTKDSVPLTSIEYDVEVAPERKIAIVPNNLTRIPQELMKVDPNTQIGELRFDPLAFVPDFEVRKNGVVTTDWSYLGSRRMQITADFNRNNIYTVAYDVAGNQDVFDVDGTYDSVALVRPEMFTETDDNGLLQLSFYPYVAWEIINNSEDWVQPDDEHAKFNYRVDAGDILVDGITYGATAERYYEPIRVLVNGVLARNITDYRGGFHPAFVEVPGQALVYQYIHVGRKLYFNRPISGATIEASYRWITQYVKLIATLRGHQAVFNPYTPELANFRLKMKTSRL
jgi:hypothetical protein